ncbi:MAG TPA: CAP domain-containing protein [Oscillospiraceae bacterium]|nr:CAP domain-containing protein [Oscillospiraceae bacterium]
MKKYAALILALAVLFSGCFGKKATVQGLNALEKDDPSGIVVTPDSGSSEASGSAADQASSSAESSAPQTSAAESSAPASSAAESSATESSAAEASAASGWETADATGYAKEFGTLINDLRANSGLSKLDYVTDLEDPAFERLAEIEQTFSHTRPDGRGSYTALDDYGVPYQAFGENLAFNYSTAQDVFDAWMSSPSHYANMVRADFTGYALLSGSAGGSQYWVLLLIG